MLGHVLVGHSPHLSWAVVAALGACALSLSQISLHSAVKTPAGQCLLGAFPSPAWNLSGLAPTETWTTPAPSLPPPASLWAAALYPAHPEGVSPAAACLWAVRWPTGRHPLPSYVPASRCPPQLLRVAVAPRAGLRSETVLPKRLLSFSAWIALGDRRRREQGTIQPFGSWRCGCQLCVSDWMVVDSVGGTWRSLPKTEQTHKPFLKASVGRQMTLTVSHHSQMSLLLSDFQHLCSPPKSKKSNSLLVLC